MGRRAQASNCWVSVAQRYHGFNCVQLVSTQHENQCEDHPRKEDTGRSSYLLKVMNSVWNVNNWTAIDISMLHAQALTLGALAGAALVEYYDRKKEAKAS
ncbi:uncharacterized protein [Phaseolus vulgaris]|uniref:uncharacterized protein isoform X1 n=1 Tax=Phaseolus vulgaris TaxID=3885 RepID=UPI0035CC8E79